MSFDLVKENVEQLKFLIENNNRDEIVAIMKELHPADIAELMDDLNIDEAKYIYLLLEGEKASDVLIEINEADRKRFLRVLPPEVIASRFIEHMDSDDATDIMAELDEDLQREVLKKIEDAEQAGDIADLLEYDEDSAGGIMAKELVKVNENWNVGTCLKEIAKQSDEVDEIFYIYVTDDNNILKGVLSIKRLILNNVHTKISNIYDKEIKKVKTDTRQEVVAEVMDKYDLVALPVVDEDGHLKGRITWDDVIDFVREEADRDFKMVSGITGDVEPGDKVWPLIRSRIPWLVVGMFGGILNANVLGAHGASLSKVTALAFFIPLIGAMGGNVGVQSSAIVVQSIASGMKNLETPFRKILKELTVGLFSACVFSLLIFIYNYFFSGSMNLTYSVSISLFVVILFASFFGTLVPLVLNHFKIDPALATGPFISTMNDILGLFIYLTVASKFFNLT